MNALWILYVFKLITRHVLCKFTENQKELQFYPIFIYAAFSYNEFIKELSR